MAFGYSMFNNLLQETLSLEMQIVNCCQGNQNACPLGVYQSA